MQQVRVNLPNAAALSAPAGNLPADTRLNLAISLPLRNQEGLSALLHKIYDPGSTNYHHYLTPGEFAEKFGPSEADYAAVQAFALEHHLEITARHPNRMLLDVRGSVPDVEQALHVHLHQYRHPTENRMFYAPDGLPTLDLGTPVLGISGLDNYALPRPRFVQRPLTAAGNAAANSGSGPSGTYRGADFRAAYVPGATLTGAGQVVALLQFDGYTASDITYYENKAGLAAVPLQNVLLDGFTGTPTHSGGEVEVSLDIEMAISMAPGLSKVMVYEAGPGGNWHDILNRMATDDAARQMSCSWYIPNGPADPVADQIFQQMAAQGQTFFCASGDGDAYTGLISFPSDDPYVTEVGGTTLTTSGPGGAWVSEQVWNWGGGEGSGGGISTDYSIPTWQTNISMTANQGSTTRRNTPDVALTADNVYVRADGFDYDGIGGTSCASPLWAGFAALVNQQAAAAGRPSIGFINPALDAIGKGVNYTSVFHDITTGNNESSFSPSRFSAVAGYDLCTGWGTPAGQGLINALANPEPLLITPQTGFISAGGVGGPFTVTSETFTLTNSGTNALTWTLVNTSAWLSVSSTGGTLNAGGPASTVTVRLNTVASNLLVGTYSASLFLTNLNDNVGQTISFALSIISPPQILSQPTNEVTLEGESVTFSVAATGGQPLSYQWQENGTNLTDNGNISGSATTNLVINDVLAGEAGTYTVIVTNAAGVAVSSNASLTITPSPPVFTLQPTNETVYENEGAVFDVAVVGSRPFAYQWIFNGTNIIGATNSVLVLTNLQLAQTGDYSVLVTNAYGATNSALALLTVNPPPPCAPVSTGMVDWWAGDGNALDSIGTNNGTLVGAVSFAPGEVGQAFDLDGGTGYVSFADSPVIDSLTTNLTVEAWIKVTEFSSQDWISMISKGDTAWELRRYSTGSTLSFWTDGLNNPELEGTRNINDGQWHHIAGVYDGTNKYIYVDGTLDVSTQATGAIAINSYPLFIGDSPDHMQRQFNGLVDEVSLYHRALSAADIQTIFEAGRGGKCPVPVVLTTEPTNETANVDGSASFVVVATGSQPLGYQWSFDGTNITGATNSELELADIQPANAGVYAVTVTNPGGSVTSSNALLTVLTQPPIIVSQPQSQTNYVGGTVTFGVVATGAPPPSYQWSFDGTNIVGATNSIMTLTNLQLAQSGGYSVMVTNAYGATNSNVAVLTVNPPPSCAPVSTGIVDWWAAEGNTMDGIGTNNGTLVNGAGYGAGEVGQAFNLNGSSEYVSFADSPVIDALTTNMTVEAWIKVTQFSGQDWISIVSKGDSSWQLRRYGTGSTLSFWTQGLSNPELEGTRNIDDGRWHHVAGVYDGTNKYLYVDGTLDAVTQATGAIAVNSNPLLIGDNPEQLQRCFDGLVDECSLYNRALSPADVESIFEAGHGGKCQVPVSITSQPANETVNAGATASWTVAATGSQPLTFQWTFDGTNIAGATNTTFILANVQTNQAGLYAVTVANGAGSATSSNALLTVLAQPPVVTSQPQSQTNYVGGTVIFSVTAAGTPPFSYQWSFDATNLPGATNSILTLTGLQSSQSGNYVVRVANSFGATNSQTAVLTIIAGVPCDPPPVGIVDWWPGEGNVNDIVGTNNGTLVGDAGYAPGEVGQAFSLDGVSGYVSLPDSPAIDSLVSAFTVEAWIKVTQFSSQDWIAMICKGDTAWQLRRYSTGSTLSFWTDGLSNPELEGNRNVNDGNWHHVAGVYDGSTKYLYVDGTLDVSEPATGSLETNSQPLLLGDNPEHLERMFDGLVDEVSLYNRALSAGEIAAIYNAGKFGKCSPSPEPPFILTQPTNETVLAGGTATFGVLADGNQPLSYQWSFNGTNLPGATNASLTLTGVEANEAGNYSALVANPYGTTNTVAAVLTVITGPSCDPAPSGLVSWWPAEGNVNDIIGTNKGTLNGAATYTAGEVGQAFSFNGASGCYVSIPNSASINALTTGITVEGWIKVTQFSSQDWISIICKGDSSWEIRRYGSGSTLSFWTQGLSTPELAGTRNVNDGNWHHVAGVYDGSTKYLYVDGTLDASASATGTIATNAQPLLLGDNPEALQRLFDGAVDEVSIYNRALSAAEVAAIYSAGSEGKCPPIPPSIATQPASQTAAAGGTASFGVTAFGSAPLNYNWKFNGTNLVGATNATLVLTNVQFSQAGQYGVVVTNNYGSITSSNAVLTVLALPSITLQPAGQTNVAGGTATFNAVAGGSQPLAYQWLKNGVALANTGNISGATTTNLVVSDVQDADAAGYSIVVTNLAGSITSSPALLVILDPPAFVSEPTNLAVTVTSNAEFNASAVGAQPLVWQWKFNGTNLPWSTNSTLMLTNVQLSQAGGYSVLVTNLYGSVLSSNGVLVVNPLFHFVWNTIPSPRFVNTPFAVVVQAQNPTNGLATNFISTVSLTSTNGLPVVPAVSAAFVQGAWTGSVMVAQTVTNLVLEATDSLSDTGLANPVNIVNLPSITTLNSGGSSALLWPVYPAGFTLETTPSLSPPAWAPVTVPPFQIGNQYFEPLPAITSNAFYRLYFPGP